MAKCKEIFKLKVGKDVSAILTGAHRIFINRTQKRASEGGDQT
jgi:hypothetical protein